MGNFRRYLEATDIFGFDAERSTETGSDGLLSRPINQFDIEMMMEFLSNKQIGPWKADTKFVNEIQWGDQPGAVKLYVDTGLTFYIKKLGTDLEGEPTWITKRMFQLNRTGYGGLEDAVAQEVHEHVDRYFQTGLESPEKEYDELENLVQHISNKVKRTAKDVFLYEGIKKVNDNEYIIAFGVRGHGAEAQDQQRVEQNHTHIVFQEDSGKIRITNFNIESPMGRDHKWEIMPKDLDLIFFPSQDREEISECLAVHFKYY